MKRVFLIVQSIRSLTTATALSNRAKFRQVSVEKKTLEHLDRIGLGFAGKGNVKKVAVQKARRIGRSFLPAHVLAGERPFPFDRGPRNVKQIDKAATFAEVQSYSGAPEVALIGRSNVGKSTLLNALLGFQSHVQEAAVSDKPGETQWLQLFSMGTPRYRGAPALVVVDMPGYGFAYLSPENEERIQKLVFQFEVIVYIFDKGVSPSAVPRLSSG
jgi:ribosome biogenesis GTPase A